MPAIRQHGEVQHCRLMLEVSQYTSMDVKYSTTDYAIVGGRFSDIAAGIAISAAANAAVRHRAEQMARPQWRGLGIGSVIMTDRRLMFGVGGSWASQYFNHLLELIPSPQTWGVTVTFEGVPPIHLRGPAAPYLTVALCALVHGTPWTPDTDYRQIFGSPSPREIESP